ncbi:MAG: formate dehydrogenase subunit gamma [Alphaproteobacteria bacterium]|nr:formate dehydrogenase subunit gamma [Alphaproteobacteria bacterium]
MTWSLQNLKTAAAAFAVALALAFALALASGPASAQQTAPAPGPEEAIGGAVPGASLGTDSDTDFWREIRRGAGGSAQQPHELGGVLIQSEGETWRSVRNGPLSTYGVWLMAASVAGLALFFALRGRIAIEHGLSGVTIERFKAVERFGHWLTAGTFIVLAITGLNMLYGRYILIPVIGKEAFATITMAGKWLHNWVAFGFMAGLVLIFVMWVAHNIPNRTDLAWLAKGGGLFTKGVHPPSRKFNAGQKIIFWATILGGVSLSLSGWALLDPFTTTMFGKTFAVVNLVGFNLPTDLTLMEEQQFAQVWHTIVSLVMIAIILAHIYIGSIGMQGAFAAMGSGHVDLNWAKEHHGLWVEEEQAKGAVPGGRPQPAE